MAWLGIITYFIYLDTQFIVSGSIKFLPPVPEEIKNIWSELESNPGPIASQANALTTRPLLLGLNPTILRSALDNSIELYISSNDRNPPPDNVTPLTSPPADNNYSNNPSSWEVNNFFENGVFVFKPTSRNALELLFMGHVVKA